MSSPTPGGRPSDRNLLFGILALQMDFVTRDALIEAMHAWVMDKGRLLSEVLVRQGALDAATHALLDALVARHLELHHGDPAESLRALSSLGSARADLERVADDELRESLALVSRPGPPGPPTRVEDSTGTPSTVTAPLAPAGQRFRVLRPHARGGLGEVFVAHDDELSREVALKEIQARFADDPNSRARFLMEAEVTGRLEHPSIVPVYGLGTYADGRPYYAMRFVKGDSLHDAIKRFHQPGAAAGDPGDRALALRQLLGRFLDVCNAVAYAHSRGVLHRDLKPGNILLGPFGETLVVDWGLARVMGEGTGHPADGTARVRPTLHEGGQPTQMGAVVGTPAYMSPEQAEGRLDRLGPASDVYSLGATLYHLLTGQAPFRGETGELLTKVARGDFAPPRRLLPTVPRALEAVCLKAMALSPADRYASPRDLAADVEHWLADEPVAACRERLAERAWRWMRRRRALVGILAAGTLAILITTVIALVLTDGLRREATDLASRKDEALRREEEERKRAQKARKDADERARVLARSLYSHQIRQARDLWAANDVPAALGVLEQVPPELRRLEWHYLARQCRPERAAVRKHDHAVRAVAFGPEGRVASLDEKGTLHVWNAVTGQTLLTLRGLAPYGLALSPGGRLLCAAGADNAVRVWEAETGHELHTLRGHTQPVTGFAFSPDGARIASAGYDRTVRVWESHTGRPVLQLTAHTEELNRVKFSPDGSKLALAAWNAVVVWEIPSGRRLSVLQVFRGAASATFQSVGRFNYQTHDFQVMDVGFSPDGRLLATASGFPKRHESGPVQVWDVQTGKQVLTLRGHERCATGVAFSPDGQLLASAGLDRRVWVWDAASGQVVADYRGRSGPLWGLAFSPDGDSLATAEGDGAVRFWDATAGAGVAPFFCESRPSDQLAFSPDGRLLAVAEEQGVTLLDLASGFPRRVLKCGGRVTAAAFGAGDRVVTATGNVVVVWSGARGVRLREYRGHRRPVRFLAFGASGQVLSLDVGGSLRLWDPESGKELCAAEGAGAARPAFSHDGQSILYAAGRDLCVRSVAERAAEQRVSGGEKAVALTFGPDGRFAAVGSDDRLRVWSRPDKPPRTLARHTGVLSLAFSPDGERLLSVGVDGSMHFWDTETGVNVLSLPLPGFALRPEEPGGFRLVGDRVGEKASEVIPWPPGSPRTGRSLKATLSPDGSRLAWPGAGRVSVLESTAAGVPPPANRAAWRQSAVAWHRYQLFRLVREADGVNPFAGLLLAGKLGASQFHVDRLIALDRDNPLWYVMRGALREGIVDWFSFPLAHPGTAFLAAPGAVPPGLPAAATLLGGQLGGWAVDDYTAALRLRPDDASLLETRACVLLKLRRWSQARADLKRAAALGAGSWVWRALALVHLRGGDRDGYRAITRSLLRPPKPGEKPSLSPGELAWILALGPPGTVEGQQLVRVAEKGLDSGPRGVAQGIVEAAIFHRGGRHAEALKTLGEMDRALPERVPLPSACFLRALTLEALGRRKEALAWLERGRHGRVTSLEFVVLHQRAARVSDLLPWLEADVLEEEAASLLARKRR